MKDSSIYVSFAQIGICKVCGKKGDLRMGACWDCCDGVSGCPIPGVPGGHELWETKNPSNRWQVLEDQLDPLPFEGGH